MPDSHILPPPLSPARALIGRDGAVVIGITVLSFILAAHFNLNEALYALTRREERFQLDELPVGILVLLGGVMWLSWRRYRQAAHELRARQVAEERLAEALVANRDLSRERLRVQESERMHLARELHDELGQCLNAIKLDATSICKGGVGQDPLAGSAALSIINTVDRVQGVVSDMVSRLRPVGLDELGLTAAIECCLDRWRQRSPETRFDLSVRGDLENLGEALNLTIYRLIQEALTNIHKHAQARRVLVSAERLALLPGANDELLLSIIDDGRGMDPQVRHRGFGLIGMRERVEMAGGTLVLVSAAGQGLTLNVRLPVS